VSGRRTLSFFGLAAVSACTAALWVEPAALAKEIHSNVVVSSPKASATEKIGSFNLGYVTDDVTGERTKYYSTWVGMVGRVPNIQLIFSCQQGSVESGINFPRIMYGSFKMRWKGGWVLLRRGNSGRYYMIGSDHEQWPDVGFFELLSQAAAAKELVRIGLRPEYGGDEITLEFRVDGVDTVVQEIRNNCAAQ